MEHTLNICPSLPILSRSRVLTKTGPVTERWNEAGFDYALVIMILMFWACSFLTQWLH